MFEKIPTEQRLSEKKNKLKKIVARTAAAGLTLGSAEMALAASDTVSETKVKKTIEQKTERNNAQAEKERLEEKFGGKIVLPEKEVKTNRDYKEDFDLGLESEHADRETPQIKQLRILAGDDKSYLDNEGSIYKEASLREMIGKYGEQRFSEVMEILKNIYPKGNEKTLEEVLKAYSFSLPQLKNREDLERKEKLNSKLYVLADLMGEGGIEKLGELFDLLKQEGYSRAFDFSWNMEKISVMIEDKEERKALIDYSEKVGLQANILKEQSGLSDEEFLSLTYKEKMKLFEALKKLGKVKEAK